MENPEFSDYLKQQGLKHEKWLIQFAKYDIESEDNILSIKSSEKAAEIVECFESIAIEDEIIILKKILGITTESQVTYKPGIESGLESVGLEPKYWSKNFSKKLGITSAEALKFVGSESYPLLERLVRHPWEKKALRELLNLDKEENVLKNQRKKPKEMNEQRSEKARQLLQQLKGFCDEGKERCDKQVEQTESEIREMLQIPPESWIQKDNCLSDCIKEIESRDKLISGEVQKRSEISDSMILESSSGGLALTGILLTNNIEDQLQDRECLLQVPQCVTLLGPALYQDDWINEFSSQAQESLYNKSFNKLGYSISASAQAGFLGFHLEGSGAYTKKNMEDDAKETHTVVAYCSTVKHSFMPLASFSFNDRELLLSVDALSALKRIDTKITIFGQGNPEVVHAFKDFFKRFGSHANRGPLHFGGVYRLKCSSSGLKRSEKAVVKRLQNEAVNAHAGFSYSNVGVSVGLSGGVDMAKIKAKYTGSYLEEAVSQTHLQVIKVGGPPELSTLTDWKTGLVTSNSTWSVIDRGSMFTLVPVWEIIANNHSNEFKEISMFIDIMQTTWKSIAKLNVQLSSLTPSSDIALVVERVTTWNKASSMSQEDLQECTTFLIGVKQALIKSTMNPKAWPLLYLTHHPIQQFLKTVLDTQNVAPPPPETAYVKQLMQQLVPKNDLTFDFPHRREFLLWLYDEGKPHQKKP